MFRIGVWGREGPKLEIRSLDAEGSQPACKVVKMNVDTQTHRDSLIAVKLERLLLS